MTSVYMDSFTEEQFDKLLRFFQVFGNESRLKIIGHLANGDRSVSELADLLGLKEPTISHHLSEMKALGLMKVRPKGTMRIYRLDNKALEAMSRDIFAAPNLAALVRTRDLDEEEKVLRVWVKDGRLVDIPAQEKKKQIVLHWLAQQIPPDRRWTEKEFSEWLAQYNEDFAFMRRYLVDNGYMARENGVYWRIRDEDAK